MWYLVFAGVLLCSNTVDGEFVCCWTASVFWSVLSPMAYLMWEEVKKKEGFFPPFLPQTSQYYYKHWFDGVLELLYKILQKLNNLSFNLSVDISWQWYIVLHCIKSLDMYTTHFIVHKTYNFLAISYFLFNLCQGCTNSKSENLKSQLWLLSLWCSKHNERFQMHFWTVATHLTFQINTVLFASLIIIV